MQPSILKHHLLTLSLIAQRRGGGGGVYGLVTEVVYKAHSDTSMGERKRGRSRSALLTISLAVTVSFRFNSTLQGHVVAGDKDADLAAFVSEMAAYAADWRVKGWAGEQHAPFSSCLALTQPLSSHRLRLPVRGQGRHQLCSPRLQRFDGRPRLWRLYCVDQAAEHLWSAELACRPGD